MKYRKKPVVIDAIQWNGGMASTKQVIEFTGAKVYDDKITQEKFYDYCNSVEKEGIKIKTLEGTMTASINDYIIKGVNGEFYPCKPDIFHKTYEAVL